MKTLYKCLWCHIEFTLEDLSHSYLCYDCAKKALLENFELMWQIKREIQGVKREPKTSSNKGG